MSGERTGAPLLRFLGITPGVRRKILLVAAASGVSNAMLLMVTNTAAVQGGGFFDLVAFIGLFALYAIGFRACFNRVTVLFEDAVERTRLRIAGKLRSLDLMGLNRMDSTAVYNRLTQQTAVISDAAGVLAASLQSAALVVFTAAYLASVSLPAFVLAVLVIGGGLLAYFRRSAEVNARMREASAHEMAFFDSIGDLIGGFKELKLNQGRSDALMARIAEAATAVRGLRIRTADLFNANYIFAYSLFYALLGVLVFIGPQYQPGSGADIMRLTAIVLFVIGPTSTVVAGIPAWAKATMAAGDIHGLEAELDRLTRHPQPETPPETPSPAPAPAFSTIELRGVDFQYRGGAETFEVGPLDLTIDRGEILFITGGNGSGKSTLLKLLCALYHPDAGQILLDGRPVGPEGVPAYRALFSAIFTDFYLFRTLDGADAIDPATVDSLLQLMRIDGKTRFEEQRFSTLDLSTGQRKRLALVVALLENRPVMIFDEWAADQDPEFRRYFYETLLPSLKRQGKTVIAVTHDEHFLHHADRLVKMEYGRIEPYRLHSHAE
ncbi:cyclic peptide export ABC transporter [Azospirillum isscasi]|uniref:Cyclic peptide export ABC transporter n=1 Tax=Azospirillum isscasi TaxID=3053926 RepID=A0ABU0WHQ0_9PROT|nr:cyclic peptide export ABC transporter [Azospirillum isscasi]MDQ2103730.1 cyclic peptide export ABC transporter [Azospirillum isscasi]